MNKKNETFETVNNIEFKYVEGVSENPAWENTLRNNINMWMSPLIKEINEKKGKIVATFMATGDNIINIENVDDNLKIKFSQRLRGFETRV